MRIWIIKYLLYIIHTYVTHIYITYVYIYIYIVYIVNVTSINPPKQGLHQQANASSRVTGMVVREYPEENTTLLHDIQVQQ